MNSDDIFKILEKLDKLSNIVVNVFIVGNINQTNSDNASVSIIGDCCNASPNSDFKASNLK